MLRIRLNGRTTPANRADIARSNEPRGAIAA